MKPLVKKGLHYILYAKNYFLFDFGFDLAKPLSKALSEKSIDTLLLDLFIFLTHPAQQTPTDRP